MKYENVIINKIIDFYSNHNSTHVSEIDIFTHLGIKYDSKSREFFYRTFVGIFNESEYVILISEIIPNMDIGYSTAFYLIDYYRIIVERQKKINRILSYENR
jgi:hypothetical protein